MSYTSIPNQPLIFQTIIPEGCEGCDSGYSQLVDFNDQLFAQFECTPCDVPLFTTGEPLIVNDCETDGLTITKNNPNESWGAIYAFAQFMQYDVIKVKIQVTSIQGVLLVLDAFGVVFEVTTTGTFEFYFPNNYFNQPNVIIGVGGNVGYEAFQGECEIISVEGIPIGGLFMGLVDAVTLQPVATIFPTITKVDNIMTAGFDMSDYEIEAGCYRLAIADYCENTCGQYYVENPFFNCLRSGVPNWSQGLSTVGDEWIIDCNLATGNIMTENGYAYMLNTVELCEGITYSITINVGTFDYGNIEAGFFIFDGTTYHAQSPQIAQNENFTFNATFTASHSGQLSFGAFQTGFGSGIIEITFVQIRAVQQDAVYDKFSDVLSIGNYSDPCRYFKIEGCNGENQFGFAFYGSSFLPSIRLEGRRFQPQYDTDTELFRYASGRWSANYVDRRKKLSYYFGRLPEYVFDFLSIVFYFDNCYVNGVLHFPAEDEFPTIEYDNADDLGAITIDLYKKNELVRKTVCIGVDADCLPSILDNNDEPFILTQNDERIITQDFVNLYQE